MGFLFLNRESSVTYVFFLGGHMPGSAISRGIRAELVREFALRALIMFVTYMFFCFF